MITDVGKIPGIAREEKTLGTEGGMIPVTEGTEVEKILVIDQDGVLRVTDAVRTPVTDAVKIPVTDDVATTLATVAETRLTVRNGKRRSGCARRRRRKRKRTRGR